MPAGHPSPPQRYTDVRDGDLWQVGRHQFACGDAEQGDTLDALIAHRQVHLVYADPPWNDGDAAVWRTRSKRDGAKGRQTSALQLVTRLLRPARDRRLLAYVEYGLPTLHAVERVLLSEGAVLTGTWMVRTTVNRKRVCGLLAVDWRPDPAHDHPHLDGQLDGDTPRLVMAHHAPSGGLTVLDPCAGLGFTSRGAEAAGWLSLNHELNPERMARAMEAMENLTGNTASLIHRTRED